MKDANWNRLENDIILPGFEEKLVPLALYRGTRTLGHVHRNFNFAVAMMHSECESTADAFKLSNNPEFNQLCGPLAKRDSVQIYSIFSRLLDHPEVTDNIPGLTAYVRGFPLKHRFNLSTVPLVCPNRQATAPWRENRAKKMPGRSPGTAAPKKPRAIAPARLFYPFVIHKPRNDDGTFDLMVAVNNAVPKGLPDHIRADICQDLIVAILSGEMDKSELQGEVKGYTRKVLQMHPLKYGDLSLDAPIGDTGMTLMDVLAA
jgi:hypothetical protein